MKKYGFDMYASNKIDQNKKPQSDMDYLQENLNERLFESNTNYDEKIPVDEKILDAYYDRFESSLEDNQEELSSNLQNNAQLNQPIEGTLDNSPLSKAIAVDMLKELVAEKQNGINQNNQAVDKPVQTMPIAQQTMDTSKPKTSSSQKNNTPLSQKNVPMPLVICIAIICVLATLTVVLSFMVLSKKPNETIGYSSVEDITPVLNSEQKDDIQTEKIPEHSSAYDMFNNKEEVLDDEDNKQQNTTDTQDNKDKDNSNPLEDIIYTGQNNSDNIKENDSSNNVVSPKPSDDGDKFEIPQIPEMPDFTPPAPPEPPEFSFNLK